MKFESTSSVFLAAVTMLFACQPGYTAQKHPPTAPAPHYVLDPFTAQCSYPQSTASSQTVHSQRHGLVTRLAISHGGVAEANVAGLTANPIAVPSGTQSPISFNIAGPTTDLNLQLNWIGPHGHQQTALVFPKNGLTITNGRGTVDPGVIAAGSHITVINFIVGLSNSGNANGPSITDDISGLSVIGGFNISPGVQAPSYSCP